jgi:hypothetical protein
MPKQPDAGLLILNRLEKVVPILYLTVPEAGNIEKM